MSASQSFIMAAASDLAWRLVENPSGPQAPRVAETARGATDAPPPSSAQLEPLLALARQVVEAVVGLSGQKLDPEALGPILQRAAEKHLMIHPELRRAAEARLAGEIPRLINLPHLAELAGRGLTLGPKAAGDFVVMGQSAAFARLIADLERVAETDFPVLLIGESGTGKELLARRLHTVSSRADGPLVAVNCAGLNPALLESELFGHVKGAFTGAGAAREGYVAAAQGGTLFLDEIGETSPEFQVRLLRVLEERVVTPVGSHQGRPVDFRLVSASHRDLQEDSINGRFNQALWFRLNVVPLYLPPLRERREDIPELLDHFLDQACLLAKRARILAPETTELLLAHDWPGNVRELSHLMQRLVALSGEYSITPADLPPGLRGGGKGDPAAWRRALAGAKGIPQARLAGLAVFLAGHQGREIGNRDLREALACSDSTAKNILGALSRAGLVEPRGQRGGRRYAVGGPPGL